MANFLSEARPDLEVVFLVRRYAAPLLEHHDPPYPAWVIEDDPPLHQARGIIHVYPRWGLAWQAFRAGIPQRIGTSRRWYHWLFCNTRLSVARKHSFTHESVLNLRLLAPLLSPSYQEKVLTMKFEDVLPYRPRLRPRVPLPEAIEEKLGQYSLRIGLHAGGKGGAPAWPTSSWRGLLEILYRRYPEALFVFTGSAEERALIDRIASVLPPSQVLRTEGFLSLSELISLLGRLRAFISGSTGPLHIAAALGVPTVSVFPATAAMGPWRWRPLSLCSQVFARQEVCRQCTIPRPCLCLAAIEPLRLADAFLPAFPCKSAQLGQQP